MSKLVLGLMSGTSADGLTVCAIRPAPFKIIGFKNYPYPSAFQQKLLGAFELKAPQLSELHYEIGQTYAKLVRRFLKDFHLRPQDLETIGSHGQTIYHGPHDKIPNTLQISEPSFLAAQLNVPVVSDFRAKDVVLGGEGAPLIPFFDEYIFGKKSPKILLNVGGISNFSLVGKNIKTKGFDAGPGNTLMDLCCQQFFNRPFDKNGALAARGKADTKLVKKLLTQKYFLQKPPKSLDKNAFGAAYLRRYFPTEKFTSPCDLLATLNYFTAAAIADQVTRFVPKKFQQELIVSGGGCYNQTLLKNLQACLPHVKICSTLDYGIDPHAKEAAAFALFAWLALHRKINHCADATGARRNSILGKISL